MKYNVSRIMKSWLFWFLIVFSFISILIFSIQYYKNSSPTVTRWNYFVYPYQNEEDIKMQIIELIELEKQLNTDAHNEYSSNYETLKTTNFVEDSMKLLLFLRENNIEYEDVAEGNVIFSGNRDRRTYFNIVLNLCFIIQIIIAAFVLCLVINQSRVNGCYMISVMLRGRRTCFWRECKTFYLLMTMFYSIQIAFVTAIGTEFTEDYRNLLFIDDNGIKVMSYIYEYVFNLFTLYLMLLFCWTIMFCISVVIKNMLIFLPVSIATIVVYQLALTSCCNNKFVLAWRTMGSSIYINSVSPTFYSFVLLIRLVICVVLVVTMYYYTRKKRIV